MERLRDVIRIDDDLEGTLRKNFDDLNKNLQTYNENNKIQFQITQQIQKLVIVLNEKLQRYVQKLREEEKEEEDILQEMGEELGGEIPEDEDEE